MALKWGSTTIGSNYNVKFNGSTVTKIYLNSTLVWEKAGSTVCSNCDGDGYVESVCNECYTHTYTRGNGECSNCRGKKYAQSRTTCTDCLGLTASYQCVGCGTLIRVRDFKKTGTTSTIDYSKSYTCGKCGKYYTNIDAVNSSCQAYYCAKDTEIYGWTTGACYGGRQLAACSSCNATGICPFCDGEGVLTTACPLCNGGGGEGGDTSSD